MGTDRLIRQTAVPIQVVGWALAAASVGSHVGCHRCHDWASIEVSDPDALDSDGKVDAIRSGIDRFVEWTGREETCVPEVRLVDGLSANGYPVSGKYTPSSQRIRLEADRNSHAIMQTTVHEFCHALDHEDGRPSLDARELFEPWAASLNADLYTSDDQRIREAFARICDDGPTLPTIYSELSEACAVSLADPAVEYVHDVAFSSCGDNVPLSRFSGDVKWVEIDNTERTGTSTRVESVTGGSGLFVLDTAGQESDLFLTYNPVLYQIDPTSGTVVDELALDSYRSQVGNIGNPPFGLLGSTTDPILYSALQPGEAWRVRTDPLRLDEVCCLPEFEIGSFLHGYEVDDTIVAMTVEGGAGPILIGTLDDSDWSTAAEGEIERFQYDWVQGLYADANGILAVFQSGSPLAVVALAWSGEVEWVVDLPIAGNFAHGIVRLPDGSIFVVPSVSYQLDDIYSSQFDLPLVLDPSALSWSIPDNSCDELSQMAWSTSHEGRIWRVAAVDLGDAAHHLLLGELIVHQ